MGPVGGGRWPNWPIGHRWHHDRDGFRSPAGGERWSKTGKVREALLGGFAGSKILEQHGERMLQRDFAPGAPARFSSRTCA